MSNQAEGISATSTASTATNHPEDKRKSQGREQCQGSDLAEGLLAGLAVGFSNRVEHTLDPSV